MRYLGGKSRISKQIISIMEAERETEMAWVEPFMGSAKVISQVRGRRIGADANHEMIALLKAVKGGWRPPTEVTRDFYYEVKNNQNKYPDHLKAFVNIGCSFGAKRWGGYATDNKSKNYALQSHVALMRLKPLISDIELHSTDYKALDIPARSLIYCDPPYASTTGYGFEFNHDEFYSWCRDKVAQGHYLFVSEYSMPGDFELVWAQDVPVTLGKDHVLTKTECLYRLHKKPPFSLKMY